jgi:hypothetical protein
MFRRNMSPPSSGSKLGLLATSFMLVSRLAYSSTLKDGGDMFLWSVSWLSKDYSVISQKTELFITTTMRISRPTYEILVYFIFFFFSSVQQITCIKFTTYILSFENRVKSLHNFVIVSWDWFWGLDDLHSSDVNRKGWRKEITVHN